MEDLFMMVLGVGGFALMILYARACNRLVARRREDRS